MNFLAQKRRKILMPDKKETSIPHDLFDKFYYKEIAKLTNIGGWSINFEEKTSFLDPQGRKILNTPDDYILSPKKGLEFYTSDEKEKVQNLYYHCSLGIPFNTVFKMQTYDDTIFWARSIGQPIFDKKNHVVGIQGIFQDINKEKLRELNLEKSLKIIESQNTNLLNFAPLVSYKLRSDASNLQMTLELFNTASSSEEELEFKDNLFLISESINNTLSHLNEIVSVHNRAGDNKKMVSFSETLQKVSHSLNKSIMETEAEIFSDFSEAPEIEYIPSYLIDILENLISNAIKYRHPDRSPVIDLYSSVVNDITYLTVKDNGLGIDLEKYGNKIFNIYQTFHRNKDAVGVGLFTTKNQIETLQGSIEVKSIIGEGTVFNIKF